MSSIGKSSPESPNVPLPRLVSLVIEQLSRTHGFSSVRFAENTFVQYVKTAMMIVEKKRVLFKKGDIKHQVVVGVMEKLLERADLSSDVKGRIEHLIENMLGPLISTLVETSKSELFSSGSCFDSVSHWLTK